MTLSQITAMRKTPVWELWQGFFVPLIFVPHVFALFPTNKPTQPGEAFFLLALRLVMSGIGIAGTVTIYFLKKESEKRLKAEAESASTDLYEGEDSAIPLNYTTDQKTMMRCEMWTLFHRKECLIPLVLFGLQIGLVFLQPSVARLGFSRGATLGLSVLLGLGAWTLFSILLITVMIHFRVAASGGVRKLFGDVTREGLVSRRPEGTNHFPWHTLHDFQFHEGDIFYRTGIQTIYFPREAFPDIQAARKFYDLLTGLHASKGARWEQLSHAYRYDLE